MRTESYGARKGLGNPRASAAAATQIPSNPAQRMQPGASFEGQTQVGTATPDSSLLTEIQAIRLHLTPQNSYERRLFNACCSMLLRARPYLNGPRRAGS